LPTRWLANAFLFGALKDSRSAKVERKGQVEQMKRRDGKVLASFVEDLFAAFA
jgi:hypothetical protein